MGTLMNKHIAHALKKIVESHMEWQWINCNRDIGFYKAREEELWGGYAYFYEINSSVVINTFNAEGEINMNPVIADAQGIFPTINIEGEFKMVVRTNHGEIIFTGEWFDD